MYHCSLLDVNQQIRLALSPRDHTVNVFIILALIRLAVGPALVSLLQLVTLARFEPPPPTFLF